MELYVQDSWAYPTQYSYAKKAYLSTYVNTLYFSSKSSYQRYYIGVRSTASSDVNTQYQLSVTLTDDYNSGSGGSSSDSTYYYQDNTVAWIFFGNSMLVFFISIAIIVVQARRINALQVRVTNLEKAQNDSQQVDMPLMQANALDQESVDSEPVPQPLPTQPMYPAYIPSNGQFQPMPMMRFYNPQQPQAVQYVQMQQPMPQQTQPENKQ